MVSPYLLFTLFLALTIVGTVALVAQLVGALTR
jgi:hypothetical protein